MDLVALSLRRRRRVVRPLLSLGLGLLLIVSPTYAQTPPAASTTDRDHPFVEHAERRYSQYLAAENQGDAAAYKEIRTRQAYEMTMDQLTKMGKSPGDLGPMLQRVASLQPDVSQLTFVRCEAKARVARLLYQREGTGPKGP